MDPRIINLYDSFTHGGMNRRDFLDRLAGLTGSAAAAAALMPLLQNNYAQAAIVAENDARLVSERVSYDSPKGKINGYLVRPTAKGKRPAIIVIEENRGLNRISRMLPGGSRSRASWLSLLTCCRCRGERRPTRTKRVNCTAKPIRGILRPQR